MLLSCNRLQPPAQEQIQLQRKLFDFRPSVDRDTWRLKNKNQNVTREKTLFKIFAVHRSNWNASCILELQTITIQFLKRE
jgi:hypothetical protein